MTFPVWTASVVRACRRLSAALAVLTVMLAGKSAFATCGDYLLHSGMSDSTRSEAASGIADSQSTAADPETLPRQPCNGPHCRQAPNAPTAPGAPLRWSTHTDHAIVTAANGGSPDSARPRHYDRNVQERLGHPDGIERPPRGV